MPAIVNKEDFFEQLPTFGKLIRGGSRNCGKDVNIMLTADKTKKNNRLTIGFNADAYELLHAQYIKIGRYKNRMIILPCSESEGVKVRLDANGKRAYAQFTVSPAMKDSGILIFAGDSYDLKYDDLYEFYYIETEVKEYGTGNRNHGRVRLRQDHRYA